MYAPFAKSVLATRSYRIIDKAVTGSACDFMILGVSTGDSSYAKALRDLNGKVEKKYGPKVREYVLINQVEDINVRFYLLAARICTLVTADVALLGDLVPAHGGCSSGKSCTKAQLPAFPAAVAQVDMEGEVDSADPLAKLRKRATGTAKQQFKEGARGADEAAGAPAEEQVQPSKIEPKPAAPYRQAEPTGEETPPSKAAPPPPPKPAPKPEVTVTPPVTEPVNESKLNANQVRKYKKLLKKARRYHSKGKLNKASVVAYKARLHWFKGADAQKLLGMIYLQKGERQFAVKFYREYLKLRPNAPDAEAIRRLVW